MSTSSSDHPTANSGQGGAGDAGSAGSPAVVKPHPELRPQPQGALQSKGALPSAFQPPVRTQDLVRQALAEREARQGRVELEKVGNHQPMPAKIQGSIEDAVRVDLVRLYTRNDPGAKDRISQRVQDSAEYGRQLHRVDAKVFTAVAGDQARSAIKGHTMGDGPARHELPAVDPYRAGRLGPAGATVATASKAANKQEDQPKQQASRGRSI